MYKRTIHIESRYNANVIIGIKYVYLIVNHKKTEIKYRIFFFCSYCVLYMIKVRGAIKTYYNKIRISCLAR